MKTFSFTIKGNHEDIHENAIPKLKKTRAQQWSPEAQRYTAWKGHIQHAFFDSLAGEGIDYPVHIRIMRLFRKPIKLNVPGKAVMDIRIFWKDNTHGDPENIFGSIADALFFNDKNLDGSFKSEIAEDKKGKVEVFITIHN